MATLDDLDREWQEKQRAVIQSQPPVEPSEAERRNGWTKEALTAYIAEREAAAALRIDPHSLRNRLARRPRSQNSKYSPFRWRG